MIYFGIWFVGWLLIVATVAVLDGPLDSNTAWLALLWPLFVPAALFCALFCAAFSGVVSVANRLARRPA